MFKSNLLLNVWFYLYCNILERGSGRVEPLSDGGHPELRAAAGGSNGC